MSPTPTTYTYKAVGDCQIKADVYRPSIEAGPTAAVVHIHGGALINGSRQGFRPRQVELYVQAGYTVISIDYRLAPESKLPEIIEDLQDAFRWIYGSGPGLFAIDPQRVAVVGHSAGGYLALMSGCCIQPPPKAIVSFYGYGDIVGDWYSKPDPFYCRQPRVSEKESGRATIGPMCTAPYEGRGKENFYLYCRQNGLWPKEVSGHDPEKEPDFFVPYCPVRNVEASYPPTLLLHGNRDTDVPYQQSVLMAEALARNHVEHALITMEGQDHGFDRDMDNPTVRDAFARVLVFLDRHTSTMLGR
ncbi:MAG: alpha/beta hydrolase [Phycisphaerae bacterium]|nr:alpha/beta hydrolase [Phycisphaerae bacterium]NIW44848.1 alpha/beta fold hydrolase [Gammaproteobacteria bacterium]NIW97706.1 alpha/beta fold hydrolase [Phycisphaerae bacterium]NIX27264.1 alpha/beta fold hydrolase [Phycisphaerae bacterium]